MGDLQLTKKEREFLSRQPFPFVKHDGGLAQAKRRYDSNNCTVRAIATATGLSYDDAHDEMARWGRAVNAGADFKRWVKERAPYLTWHPLPAVKGQPRMTTARFCKAFPEGRYILSIANHVLPVVDGITYDISPWAADNCVYGYWQVDLKVLDRPDRGLKPVDQRRPLTRKQAEDITDRIRTTAEALWELLWEAYERKAWKALGYKSWKAYIEGEFDFNRAHSYRLLTQARVIHELRSGIAEVSPDGDTVGAVVVSEAEARDIAPQITQVVDDARTRVAAGTEPGEAVAEAVSEARGGQPTSKPNLSQLPAGASLAPSPADSDGVPSVAAFSMQKPRGGPRSSAQMLFALMSVIRGCSIGVEELVAGDIGGAAKAIYVEPDAMLDDSRMLDGVAGRLKEIAARIRVAAEDVEN